MTDINKKFLPISIVNRYKEILIQNGLDFENAVDISDWVCTVNDEWTLAFVCMDWRYPQLGQWYSLNHYCTEMITALEWNLVLKLNWEIQYLKVWDTYPIMPWNKYSITWTVIVRVDISPKRDSSQNSFVQL